jgi:hypothetical protein
MNITLWVLQVLLAMAFLAHGLFFLSPPAQIVDYVDSLIPPGFRIFIGVAELLAAVGLIVPGVTRNLPWLVSAAAAGLMTVMIGASTLHAVRGELTFAITTFILFVVATFIAYMRWKVMPIAPRARTVRPIPPGAFW